MRLQLLFKFHCFRYDDQDPRGGEYVDEIVRSPRERNRRNERNERKINRAEQRNAVGNLFEIVFRRFTGANTLNETAVLLNTLGYVFCIELHLRVEEREREDEKAKDHRVDNSTACNRRRTGHPLRPPSVEPAVRPEQACNHLREADDGEREDQGHNAASCDSDGDHRRLSAVHLSAFDLLCVLYGHFPFGKVYVYDCKEDDRANERERNQFPDIFTGIGRDLFDLTENGRTSRRD